MTAEQNPTENRKPIKPSSSKTTMTATASTERRRPSLKRPLTTAKTAWTIASAAAAAAVSLSTNYPSVHMVTAFGSTNGVTTTIRSSSTSATASSNIITSSTTTSPFGTTSIFYTTNDHEDDPLGSTDDILQYPIHFFQHATSSSSSTSLHQHHHRQQQRPVFADDDDEDVSSTTGAETSLPTWLRLSRAHLVHENMELLREAMLNSFFTETEVLKLTYAIQEASNGKADLIAGAAEFATIMIDTMEMGLNALVAGVFHYCSCVEARQKTLLPSYSSQEQDDPLAPWDFRPHQGIESFGDHAMQIERDAARLKRLEVVASMVVQNSNTNAAATTTTATAATAGAANAADNLRNLYLTEAQDWRGLAIRGAACLYRLRGIIKSMSPSHKLSKESNRVCREALHIYAPLASRLGMHRLKNELEHAAFRLLYKRQYHTVESLLHQTRQGVDVNNNEDRGSDSHQRRMARIQPDQPDIGESMEQILEQVQREMTDILQEDSVFVSSVANFQVTARVKESYSTWRKMLRNSLDSILQVPDALALRVVLEAKKEWNGESASVTRARERALCYYAQHLLMNVWTPHADNPRFKDYIAKPKENGYQSLHYTATTPWHGEDWTMEIQVRSSEMHKVAEFGVASHWNYKAMAKPPTKKTHGSSSMSSNRKASQKRRRTPIRIEMSEDHGFGKVMADHNTDAYLRSLQEWHWHQHGSPVNHEPLVLPNNVDSKERADRIRARTQRLAPYIEALTSAKTDLQRENVFVFVSPQNGDSATQQKAATPSLGEGMVVALPAGAVVSDVIQKCDLPDDVATQIEEAVTHNGSPAMLSTPLQNGDVLSIPSVIPTLTCA